MQTQGVREPWGELTGGTAVWIFMAVEVVTFGLFLLVHAWGWRGQPEVFAQAQALLHSDSGLRGTALLLLGSGLAYQSVLSHAAGRRAQVVAALVGAGATGIAFTLNKLLEYASPALEGITLSTNHFWFSYLFLTGLHLLHVVGGVAAMFYLAACALGSERVEPLKIEAGAAYWHLIDLVWIMLFPILYLMHP